MILTLNKIKKSINKAHVLFTYLIINFNVNLRWLTVYVTVRKYDVFYFNIMVLKIEVI